MCLLTSVEGRGEALLFLIGFVYMSFLHKSSLFKCIVYMHSAFRTGATKATI